MPVKLDDDKIKYVIREKEKGTLNATIAESNSGVWHPGIHPVGQRILLCGRAKRHAEGNMDAYYLSVVGNVPKIHCIVAKLF